MSNVLDKQTGILRDIFSDKNLVVTRETNADSVRGWDSFVHIQIITAIEKEFKVRFALGELQSLKNVGDMEDLILKKLDAI